MNHHTVTYKKDLRCKVYTCQYLGNYSLIDILSKVKKQDSFCTVPSLSYHYMLSDLLDKCKKSWHNARVEY